MRFACAALLVVIGCGCAPESAPPREVSPPAERVAPRGDNVPDSLDRADELVAALELQALGTEPFWSVAITRQRIVYSDPEHPDGIAFPYRPPTDADHGATFESARDDSAPHAIRIAIVERTCSDGMSDVRYRYAASVRLDSLVLHGCARYRPR